MVKTIEIPAGTSIQEGVVSPADTLKAEKNITARVVGEPKGGLTPVTIPEKPDQVLYVPTPD
ncbi:MAG: hypothetical protein HN981_05025 [Candidatus Pacebacteria bacterium]|jgi:hypothetical protein|nr:hypothetical protein [Candidatus Paceibacterota bacterium]MBT4652342.1 hypothetical protein [Candidatus Paceibacterota bacterium]MBT6756169.1 hypothetical protein [Candidatus Paceibacterota bacterium]MBT6921726.1 hypothetical protein [Candidatus Paceibacterota bacterium]